MGSNYDKVLNEWSSWCFQLFKIWSSSIPTLLHACQLIVAFLCPQAQSASLPVSGSWPRFTVWSKWTDPSQCDTDSLRSWNDWRWLRLWNFWHIQTGERIAAWTLTSSFDSGREGSASSRPRLPLFLCLPKKIIIIIIMFFAWALRLESSVAASTHWEQQHRPPTRTSSLP